jgi:hypothetical protein
VKTGNNTKRIGRKTGKTTVRTGRKNGKTLLTTGQRNITTVVVVTAGGRIILGVQAWLSGQP